MKKYKFVTIREVQKKSSKKIRKGTNVWFESGAENELTTEKNIKDLDNIQIYPKLLNKNFQPSIEVNFLNKKYPSPLILAPMGHQTQFHKDGEIEMAKGTKKSKILSCFNTQGRINLNEIKKYSKNDNLIWQIFLFGDKEWIIKQIRLAEKNKCLALSICLDAPVRSYRYSDRETRYDARKYGRRSQKVSPDIEMALKYDFSIIGWIKKQTKLPIIPKGIVNYKDTIKLIDQGVDALWLSNHGGRMFNSGISGIDILNDHKKFIKTKLPIIVDGGVRKGSDIIKYLSLGADMIGIGRPAIYGLIADGYKGVENVFDILHNEFKIAMTNGGYKNIAELNKSNIRINE